MTDAKRTIDLDYGPRPARCVYETKRLYVVHNDDGGKQPWQVVVKRKGGAILVSGAGTMRLRDAAECVCSGDPVRMLRAYKAMQETER